MLFGTGLITHGHRIGWIYLCAMQLPAGVYDVATRQWGFIATSFIGGALYWRGWKRRGLKLETPSENHGEQSHDA
jgi:hypothetical protein